MIYVPYLYGQPELEPVQGVADANLPLDLSVGEGGHDIPYLYSHSSLPELEPVQGVADAYLPLDLRAGEGRHHILYHTCIASLSMSLCRGLLMPISRWISVPERADMIYCTIPV
jgi:hypothetical protein